jgi:subfamily B ATP-binding cassette protein MsbA
VNVYPRLLRYLRPHWKPLAASILFMLLFAALSGFSIAMVVPFTRIVLTGQDLPSGEIPDLRTHPEEILKPATLQALLYGAIRGRDRLDALRRFCVALLILFGLKNLFWYFQSYLVVAAEQGVMRDLRDVLYAHYHRLSLDYFRREKSGELISRLTNDITLMRGAIANGFAMALRQVFLLAAYLVAVLMASWQLFLLAAVLLPPSLFLIDRIGQTLRRHSTVAQEKMAAFTSILQETIAGIRVIKAFRAERFEIERFRSRTEEYRSTMVRLTRHASLAPPMTEFVGIAVAVVILWFGGQRIVGGMGMEPGRFLLFLVGMFSLMQPVKVLSQVNLNIQQGLAAAARMFEILDEKPTVVEAEDAVGAGPPRDGIEFRDVSFEYDPGQPVLSRVSLRARVGEIIALVGPSGGGKSTIADLVARFYDPTSGSVTWDGVDLRRIRLADLRRQLGFVSQETVLFNESVAYNIAYGHPGATDEEIAAAARAANADDFIRAMPAGYATEIGDRGVRMSGGQRQRVAIARALLVNPPLLVLDEATSALDTESEALVQEALDRLMEGRTTFVIAHRLSTVRHAHRIYVVAEGRIVQQGTHDDLVREEGLYRKLHQMQFRDAPPDERAGGCS